MLSYIEDGGRMGNPDKHNESIRTPNGEPRLEQLKVILREPTATLHAAQKAASDQVRTRTKPGFGRLVDAHLLVCGVLGGVLLRTNGKRTQDSLLIQERRVLFASYVVGMPLCEQAIEEGRYLQALTLLRQEMETLAQIITSHAGRRKPGKQATMSVLAKDISRIYGDLSAAAHASNHDMASELLTKVMETEEAISRATYFYPVENLKLARQAFALHLILTMNVIGQIAIDYNKAHPEDGFGPLDKEALHLALDLMKEEGLVEDASEGC
jgi:hypothetical protein